MITTACAMRGITETCLPFGYVAEIGSALLCADLGIVPELEPRPDHAAYVGSWLTVLAGDKRAIFQAAAHAQRAVTFLHGLQPQAETTREAA